MDDETWVLDATIAGNEPPWPFCPYNEETGETVVGLTFVSTSPPGRFLGVVHADGQDAVEKWVEGHREALDQIAGEED